MEQPKEQKPLKNPVGRPSDFSDELAKSICDLISGGSNFRKVCSLDGMPSLQTIFRWRHEKPAFGEQIRIAMENRAETRNDDIDQLKDDVKEGNIEPTAASVILKATIWQASKESPKRFGERTEIEHSGTVRHTDEEDEKIIEQYIESLKNK